MFNMMSCRGECCRTHLETLVQIAHFLRILSLSNPDSLLKLFSLCLDISTDFNQFVHSRFKVPYERFGIESWFVGISGHRMPPMQ